MIPNLIITRGHPPRYQSSYVMIQGDAPGSVSPLTPPAIRIVYQDEANMSRGWAVNLARMSRLPKGWNGYNAPPPSERARLIAQSFLDVLLKEDMEPSRLAPSAVGGVGLSRRKNGRKVYVEFFNDGKVFALFSDGETGPISREVELGHQHFKALVGEMRDYLDA
jgi:hypothetical protein